MQPEANIQVFNIWNGNLDGHLDEKFVRSLLILKSLALQSILEIYTTSLFFLNQKVSLFPT